MKGKKIDVEFVNNFITNCLLENKTSAAEIIKFAQDQINDIDVKLQQIETLKKTRAKLSDVIFTFDKPTKQTNCLQTVLHLFEIKNHHLCQKILYQVRVKPISILEINIANIKKEDLLFTIKELLQHNVIAKKDDVLIPGEYFDDFMLFVLKEKT